MICFFHKIRANIASVKVELRLYNLGCFWFLVISWPFTDFNMNAFVSHLYYYSLPKVWCKGYMLQCKKLTLHCPLHHTCLIIEFLKFLFEITVPCNLYTFYWINRNLRIYLYDIYSTNNDRFSRFVVTAKHIFALPTLYKNKIVFA